MALYDPKYMIKFNIFFIYVNVANTVKKMVNTGNCLSSGTTISRPPGLLPAFLRFLAPMGTSSTFSLSKCVNSKLFTAKQGHVSAEVLSFAFHIFSERLQDLFAFSTSFPLALFILNKAF